MVEWKKWKYCTHRQLNDWIEMCHDILTTVATTADVIYV